MNPVEVKEQVRLPLIKCAELVLSGIRFRLFRAAITVTIVSLAVAFLMAMLTESVVARKVADTLSVRTQPRRHFLFWVNRLSAPMTEATLTDEMAARRPGDDRWEELKTWGGLRDDQLDRLVPLARLENEYLSYFAGLTEGQRIVLVGRAQGTEILASLASSDERFRDFAGKLKSADRQPPHPAPEFQAFLRDWKETQPLRQAILAGHRKALQGVQGLLGGREPRELLADADDALPHRLAGFGFRLAPSELPTLREQARRGLAEACLSRMLTVQMAKQRLADLLGVTVPTVNDAALFSQLRGVKGAEWFLALTREEAYVSAAKPLGIPPLEMSPEEISRVASQWLADNRLSEVEATVAEAAGAGEGQGFLGFSSRTLWLILISFVVCVVGIANAMLMSVTERFREIATMKCLGATDGFIMINFILESCLQGSAGGLAGMVVGFVLGLLRSWANYGSMVWSNLPPLDLLSAGGIALAAGITLSAMAAVYPAWVAARLAPMEAMRIE